MSDIENEEPNLRRSSRSRKQRDVNPCDFLDDELNEGKKEEVSEDTSPSNDANRSEKPMVRGRRYWASKTNADEFSTVDTYDFIYTSTNYWTGGRHSYNICSSELGGAEESLVAKQDEHEVMLECKRSSWANISQVPYHADLLPHWNYFSEGIQQHSDLRMFTIINHHLPPSPWLGDNILPVLARNGNMTSLELRNCGLSGDDLTALVAFLAGNKTIRSLDISHNNVDSVDTCKALAKAIKKHPVLRHVNLTRCRLGGRCHDLLDKLLAACKGCDSLEIGHDNFDSKSVALIAKFLGKKNNLTSFSLMGARVGKDNKKSLEEALVNNKGIERLCLRFNGLQLPGILRATNEAAESLSRLTHLDLSYNSLPVQGAKVMAKFLEKVDSALVSLIMTNNHLTTKGANLLLPALTENTTLENLDLSKNWLSDAVAPAVIDLLQNNSTLRNLDLSGNKSLRAFSGGKFTRLPDGKYGRTPIQDRGRATIVKGALFDTSSLEKIANSNHTCAVFMTGMNQGDSHEETIRKINALEVSEGKKIRYKVVLALNEANRDLYDPRSFNDVPLELMPYVLEMLQQEMGVNGFGKDVVAKSAMKDYRGGSCWSYSNGWQYFSDPTLRRIFEVITTWHSFPLLFNRGAGDFEFETEKKTVPTKKKSKKSRKRRRLGDEEDDEDEAYVPRGVRTTGRHQYNPETHRYVYLPPPAEFR